MASLIVASAVASRWAYIEGEPFWVDEAESSINALTILEHGYPTDTYLGLPIYENTSMQPWPGNAEYGFRDVSYSDNHLAVYHGWLPLYSIAAPFAVYGIRPDAPNQPHAIKHDLAERKRSTAAARMPGVLFGVIFAVLRLPQGRCFTGATQPGLDWCLRPCTRLPSAYPGKRATIRRNSYLRRSAVCWPASWCSAVSGSTSSGADLHSCSCSTRTFKAFSPED